MAEVDALGAHPGSDGIAEFLAALADHLSAPSDQTWRALQASADVARRGEDTRPGGPAGWASDLGWRIGGLLEGDRATWAALLHGLLSDARLDGAAVSRLRDLSPFSGRILVTTERLRSGESFGGDLRAVVGGTMPADAGAALLVLDRIDFGPVETVTVR